MFKKSVSYVGKHKLSGADQKKLRRSLAVKLPKASDEDLQAILPSKGDISVAKLGPPHRGLAYFNGNLPMIIDLNGKGDTLMPTVFALWAAPNVVPTFQVSDGSRRFWQTRTYLYHLRKMY
jgi:translation initiation factor 2D